jgi:hypothetical protein
MPMQQHRTHSLPVKQCVQLAAADRSRVHFCVCIVAPAAHLPTTNTLKGTAAMLQGACMHMPPATAKLGCSIINCAGDAGNRAALQLFPRACFLGHPATFLSCSRVCCSSWAVCMQASRQAGRHTLVQGSDNAGTCQHNTERCPGNNMHPAGGSLHSTGYCPNICT